MSARLTEGPAAASLRVTSPSITSKQLGRRLQEFGGDFDGFGPHRAGGDPRRLAGHDRDARSKGAEPILDAVGAAVGHADFVVVNAKCVGADLRDDGLDALSNRGRTGNHLHIARSVDGDFHLVERTEPAFFHKQRDAGADKLAGGLTRRQRLAQLRPRDRSQRLVEQPRIVAGIEHDFGAERVELARIGHFVAGDQVAASQLDRVEIEFCRNGIHQPLAHERALEAAGSAVSAAGRFVG